MGRNAGARAALISAVVIWGSIGLFVRSIPLPSSVIALVRGGVGTLFLLLSALCARRAFHIPKRRRVWLLLLLSGGLIGFNWILLFEAYRYTTIASATLCYYMAPVFVLLAAPLVLKEQLTAKKLLYALCSLLGILLISGVLTTGGRVQLTGILLGLAAAAFYATVVLINKQLSGLHGFDATVVQLGIATLVLLPYTLLTEDLSAVSLSWQQVCLLLLLGIVHTGAAYGLYFSALPKLPGQTIALLSYLDPLTAILLSALFLKEPLGLSGVIGALLILGSTLLSELTTSKKTETSAE